MNGIGDFFPRRNLIFVVDARHVGVAGGAGRDEGGFGDEEGPGDGGALAVVFYCKPGVDVGIVGAVAGEGCHYDTVGERDGADMDGTEKCWGHGGQRGS